jgi:hypothetical protein
VVESEGIASALSCRLAIRLAAVSTELRHFEQDLLGRQATAHRMRDCSPQALESHSFVTGTLLAFRRATGGTAMIDTKGFSLIHVITSFFAGAASGAVLALLAAPRSGDETRKRLADLLVRSAEDASRIPHAVRAASAAAAEAFARSLHTVPVTVNSGALHGDEPQPH